MSECLLFTTKWVNACCLPPNEWMPVVYHQMSECLLFTTKWVNACCLPPNEWMPVVYHQMSECLLFTTKWVNACCLPPNEWMPVVYHHSDYPFWYLHTLLIFIAWKHFWLYPYMYFLLFLIVSVLASSVVDRKFELRSAPTNDYKTGTCCFSCKHIS
jgi:hypothetical protein